MCLQESVTYVNNEYDKINKSYLGVDPQILKSSLIYQYLYVKHFGKPIDIYEVWNEVGDDLRLIGTSNTKFLQHLFSKYECIKKHAMFHDAYCRFYSKHKRDRGYCYALPHSTSYMKSSPLFGHASGITHQMLCTHNI